MTSKHAVAGAGAHDDHLTIRTLRNADLFDALAKGYADFKAVPSHLFFLCLIYPVVTLIFARAYAGYEMLPILFPLFAGFTLLGPLVALGGYELSRRREAGEEVSISDTFGVLRSPAISSVVVLGVLLAAIFVGWIAVAQSIYVDLFGAAAPESVAAFINQILATPEGSQLILVGCVVGFFFAIVVLAVSVVSFPLLLDRNVGVVTAIQTSIRAVLANPLQMAIWGFLVAVILIVAAIPLLVGLAVVIPVLAHATWHLYRKVVEH
jgi:uncharacterized membrane protein